MILAYKEYTIEVTDDQAYKLHADDNSAFYSKIYNGTSAGGQNLHPTAQYGVRVYLGEREIASVLICETGGYAGVQTHTCIIYEDTLLICCCDKVYALKLPDLTMYWKRKADPATCFGIYAWKDDFVIHGELHITRIDIHGNEKWSFGGRDIFVTPDGSSAFELRGDKIILTDWGAYTYKLDSNGIVLNNDQQ